MLLCRHGWISHLDSCGSFSCILCSHRQCLGDEVKSPSPLPEFKGAELLLRDYVEQEIEKVRSEVREEIKQLKAEVDQLRITVGELNGHPERVQHNIIL